MNVLNQCNLDDLLFAKFAELDQKVAMLKEEMDSIATLLERRKRIRDTSITLANRIIREADCLPKWALCDSWQSSASQDEIVEDSVSSLSFSSEVDKKISGRLCDSNQSNDSKQSNNSNVRIANAAFANAHAHLSYHPYSRPSSCRSSPSSINTSTMRSPMSLLLMSDFQQTTENVRFEPEYFEILADIDDGKAQHESKRLLDSAEDPPSDPDDNMDESARN